jgi:hypothetical protein
MLTMNLALVSEVKGHDPSDVAKVAAALQKQVTRDFGPLWEVQATVDAFPRLEDVPVGYWPLIVKDDIGQPGAAGVHLDKDGQPFALITMSDSWSLTASHEMLEMAADPFGSRVIAGPSPKSGQGRVEFLVEVCDPSEAAEFGYTSNGTLVSDFYTPHFFDPVVSAATRYSFTGAIKQPRTILRGGYFSWHDPASNHWWQQTWFGQSKQYRDLGVFAASGGTSLRPWIDSQTDHPGIDAGLKKTDSKLREAVAAGKKTGQAASYKAQTLRTQISGLIEGKR